MPTRERLPTSYMQLKDLLSTVTEEWPLFEPYFPPQNIWEARMEEIQQIRHRVAHFRVGHKDDQRRVKQVLRTSTRGFWRFCTSYNTHRSVLPAQNDRHSGIPPSGSIPLEERRRRSMGQNRHGGTRTSGWR